MDVLVVTPTYNERENLPLLAAGVLKHDGYRLIVQRKGKCVRLFTRNGHDWSHRYPLIGGAGAAQPQLLVRNRRPGGAARLRRHLRLQRHSSTTTSSMPSIC